MSGKVSGWVWDQDLPMNEKYILLAYADHADHEGHNVFPGLNLIVKKTGYSLRSVRRLTSVLEAKGYLISEGGRKGGRSKSNRWSIPIYGVIKAAAGVRVSGDEKAATPDLKAAKSSIKAATSDTNAATAMASEPSLELELEPSFNRGEFSKNDQTPLALVKAAILTDLNNGKMYAPKPEIFKIVYEPLQSLEVVRAAGLGSHPIWRVNLEHPDPDVFDDRLEAMLEQKLSGVLGAAVDLQISGVRND